MIRSSLSSFCESSPLHIRLAQLARLVDDDVSMLMNAFSIPRSIRARTDLVHYGDRADRIHILIEGWACRYKVLPDGRRQITAVVLPGDFCNLDSLYTGNNHYAVAALNACTFTTIESEALRNLAISIPTIGMACARLIAVDNAMLTERSTCLGRRSAREHLAHFLCELTARLSFVGLTRSDGFPLFMTQEDIGDVLGLTAIHVNRTMQGLKSDNIIEGSDHRIGVRDLNELHRIAGYDCSYLNLGVALDNEKIPTNLNVLPNQPRLSLDIVR